MDTIADRGARLRGFALECPEPDRIATLLRDLGVDLPPVITPAPRVRYRAQIETPHGLRELS